MSVKSEDLSPYILTEHEEIKEEVDPNFEVTGSILVEFYKNAPPEVTISEGITGSFIRKVNNLIWRAYRKKTSREYTKRVLARAVEDAKHGKTAEGFAISQQEESEKRILRERLDALECKEKE